MRGNDLGSLLERLDTVVNRIDGRFDDMDKRLRAVETKSDTTAQVGRIERVVDQLLNSIGDRFKELDTQVDTRFKEIDASVNARFREIDNRLRIIDRWRWASSAATLGAGAAAGFAARSAFFMFPPN
jgi:hypothetical protein